MSEASAAVPGKRDRANSKDAAGSKVRTAVIARRVGLVALTGLLGTLAFPLAFPVGPRTELFASGILEPLAFVCLVPTLIALRGVGSRKSFFWGFLAGMFFFTGVFWWVNVAMTTFGGMPHFLSIPALLLLAAWCACHWGLAFGATRMIEKGFGWPVWWVFPPVWMATELLRNYLFSGFPWGNLGYTQMRNLWLSQVGGIAGVYGVALLVAFVNAAVYEVWHWKARRESPFPRTAVLAAVAALVLGHVYGAIRVWRYDAAVASAPKAKVGVVQGNIDQRLKNVQGQRARTIFDAYNPATVAADHAGSDLIVWPEAAFPLAFPVGSQVVPWAAQNRGVGLSEMRYDAHLLLGVDIYDPRDLKHGNENSSYLVSPDRRVLKQYTKHHLVPFGEYVLFDLDKYLPIDNLVPGTFKPGESLVVMEVPRRDGQGTFKVAPEICFDAIFPEISREYANLGAQVLVNLTNDAWYGFSAAPFQFLRMVAMRSVETGLPVARAANTGISAFIDGVGRIQQPTPIGLVESELDRLDASMRVQSEWRVQEVALVDQRTPYVVIGDVPAYLAALFSVVVFGLALGRVRRSRRNG